MHSFKYFFREGWKGLKNNVASTAGTIITIFLSLLLIGIFACVGSVIGNVTSSIEEQVSVTAYISDDYTINANEPAPVPRGVDVQQGTNPDVNKTKQQVLDEVKAELKKIDGVSDVTFTSKEAAMDNFKDTMKSDPEIVEQLEGQNPLPASFNLVLSNPEKVESIANAVLSNQSFLKICDSPDNPTESVKYGQKTVDRLFGMIDVIRIISIIFIVLLIFAAFVFMNNTIRLAVMNRRKEIAIQKLVGATDSFIRGPFLAEGAILALLGALCAIISMELIHWFAFPRITASLAWLPLELPITTYILIYLAIIFIGLIIGLISSALAVKKYLKV